MANESFPIERRRTERVSKELLIEVYWTDARGREINAQARTLQVGRHGAKILLRRELDPGQEIGVYCPETGKEGRARVGGLPEKGPGGYSCRIEFLDDDVNLWNLAYRLLSETID